MGELFTKGEGSRRKRGERGAGRGGGVGGVKEGIRIYGEESAHGAYGAHSYSVVLLYRVHIDSLVIHGQSFFLTASIYE